MMHVNRKLYIWLPSESEAPIKIFLNSVNHRKNMQERQSFRTMTSVQTHCALPESTEVCLTSAQRQKTTGCSSRTVPNWSSHIRCSLLIHTSLLWNLQSESWAGNLFWKYLCIAQQSGNKSESKGTFHSSRERGYEAYWEFTKFCKNRKCNLHFPR